MDLASLSSDAAIKAISSITVDVVKQLKANGKNGKMSKQDIAIAISNYNKLDEINKNLEKLVDHTDKIAAAITALNADTNHEGNIIKASIQTMNAKQDMTFSGVIKHTN